MEEEIERGGFLGTLERNINDIFDPLVEFASKVIFFPIPGSESLLGVPGGLPFVVAWLVVTAAIVTVYFGFVQFHKVNVSLEVVRGKYSSPDDPGEVTHFQALASAVSGTVGLGNIAGVAIAVSVGGPGATFWMIVCGLLGMATKFVECTLGVKYREIHEDGTVSGGPFKYLPIAFAKLGKVPAHILTGIFAVAIMFFGVAGGNMFQANQTYAQAVEVTGGADSFLASDGMSVVAGLVLAGGVALVIIGGIKSIGKVTDKLVPAMGIIYIVACLIVLIRHADHVPAAMGEIFTGAFDMDATAGGIIGVIIIGFQRAAFSNEAGLGSAPIAHSAVKTRRPASEGFVALLEPFIDTVVVCTMTALTIVIAQPEGYLAQREAITSGGEQLDIEGVTLTSAAFESVVSWFPYILALAVALFAFSTLITWAYYGQKAWEYLFGRSKIGGLLYKCVFCFFTVMGAVLTLGSVVDFADTFLFVCAFVNLLGLYFLLPVVKKEVKEYLADRKSGRLMELGKLDEDKEIHPEEI